MIGTFALFDIPGVGGSKVFAAVFTYRLIAFWLPLLPGIFAFFQLRGTVKRWDEAKAARIAGRAGAALPVDAASSDQEGAGSRASITSESEVRSEDSGNVSGVAATDMTEVRSE